MAELASLGVRTVPVVVRGREYVFAQELADVSKFIGRKVEFDRLSAAELMTKWQDVLAAARRHALQIPPEKMAQWATQGRDRSIRDLAYHVYQVPEAFLELVEHGVQDLPAVYNVQPPGWITSADISVFGGKIQQRLDNWWSCVADKSCSGAVTTYYGEQTLHHVLERCTWHSAQHVRQIQAVLEELGVKPDGPLGEKDYAGLPMPKGLWE